MELSRESLVEEWGGCYNVLFEVRLGFRGGGGDEGIDLSSIFGENVGV